MKACNRYNIIPVTKQSACRRLRASANGSLPIRFMSDGTSSGNNMAAAPAQRKTFLHSNIHVNSIKIYLIITLINCSSRQNGTEQNITCLHDNLFDIVIMCHFIRIVALFRPILV